MHEPRPTRAVATTVGTTPHTYEWARATNGSLSSAEKKEVKAGIRAGYLAIARGLATWPVRRAPRSGVLPSAPDSRLAKEAEEAAKEQGPALAFHGYRTWVLGSALADFDGATLDDELFFATSLLHDSGMMREVVGQDFTIRSGERLIAVAARAGSNESVGLALADSAVAHASPGLKPSDDLVGFYVQSGAMADLAGLHMWHLPRGLLKKTYGSYPAHGVHHEIPPLIRREAQLVPDGRFALLKKNGMDLMVSFSPTRRYAGRLGGGSR